MRPVPPVRTGRRRRPGPVPGQPARAVESPPAAVAVFVVLAGAGVVVGGYYVDSVPAPDQLSLPESTMVYFADGRTPMAKLGTENRTILRYEDMEDAAAGGRP
jgi:hypothetical protein